jgi:hypothetical protein
MPSQRVRIAMDAYDAWNRGDFDAMIELHFNGKGTGERRSDHQDRGLSQRG